MAEKHTRQNTAGGSGGGTRRSNARSTNPVEFPTEAYDIDGNPVAGYSGLYCWCGEQHDQKSPDPKYWGPGVHPWPTELGGEG